MVPVSCKQLTNSFVLVFCNLIGTIIMYILQDWNSSFSPLGCRLFIETLDILFYWLDICSFVPQTDDGCMGAHFCSSENRIVSATLIKIIS